VIRRPRTGTVTYAEDLSDAARKGGDYLLSSIDGDLLTGTDRGERRRRVAAETVGRRQAAHEASRTWAEARD
jgi:hypothetical protein